MKPLALFRLRRDMLGRLWAPEGGMAPPEAGLNAGMESDSAKLEAIERLGEERRAASNSSCSSGTQSISGVKALL